MRWFTWDFIPTDFSTLRSRFNLNSRNGARTTSRARISSVNLNLIIAHTHALVSRVRRLIISRCTRNTCVNVTISTNGIIDNCPARWYNIDLREAIENHASPQNVKWVSLSAQRRRAWFGLFPPTSSLARVYHVTLPSFSAEPLQRLLYLAKRYGDTVQS